MKTVTVSKKAVRVRFNKTSAVWKVWHWRKFVGSYIQKNDAGERAEQKRMSLLRDKFEHEERRGPGYREVPI